MKIILITLILCFALIPHLFADDFIIYPNKGQSEKQEEKDKYDCYEWARRESSFDPSEETPPTASSGGGSSNYDVAKGAVGGAAAGAAIGEIVSHDAGMGAAIGLLSGGLFGSIHKSNQEKKHREAQQQEQYAYASEKNRYDRAYKACLEGRGYTVN